MNPLKSKSSKDFGRSKTEHLFNKEKTYLFRKKLCCYVETLTLPSPEFFDTLQSDGVTWPLQTNNFEMVKAFDLKL